MNEQTSSKDPIDDEVDLSVVLKSIKNFLKKILLSFFNIFNFFNKHKFVLIGLIVLGAVLGYFYEKNTPKTYTNDLLVTPNFESSDYLYAKVEAINNKISIEDSLFLKEVFGKQHKKVTSLEIKPVIDIYNFVSENEANQNLFELLFEEEESIDFIENPINSRNFRYHRIYLAIKGGTFHQELSQALIDYINNNTYYNDLKVLSLESLEKQLVENHIIIKQIDSILRNAQAGNSLALDSKAMFFSDNTGLNNLISQKENLIRKQQFIKRDMLSQTNIIKLVDANYKILDTEDFLKKDKVKLFPLIFVVLYSLIFLLRYIFKKAKSLTP